MSAVCEAARNVACTGARPAAVTNCLNFGNPEHPEVAYELAEAIEGMALACEALGLPVVSGNVSLYNEHAGQPIQPTPVVGVVGVLEDAALAVSAAFREVGDVVLVAGDGPAALDGSEYQKRLLGEVAGEIPEPDLDAERALHGFLAEAAAARLLQSAHDISSGGLAVALAESAILGGVGVDAPAADAAVRRGRGPRRDLGSRRGRPGAGRARRQPAAPRAGHGRRRSDRGRCRASSTWPMPAVATNRPSPNSWETADVRRVRHLRPGRRT